MKLRFPASCRLVDASILRVLAVAIGISMILLKPGYCPTGNAGCDMDGMAQSEADKGSCLLACDVPLESALVGEPAYVGLIVLAPRPSIPEQSGGLIQPDTPPPRTLM